MNKCMEIELLGGIGEGSFEFVSPSSGFEISVKSGHAVEAGVTDSDSEASFVCGGIVPEGSSYEWEQSMEFGGMDFAFVYIGPALQPIEIRSCYGMGYWIPSRPWLSNESWKY